MPYIVNIPIRHPFEPVSHDSGNGTGRLKLVGDRSEQMPQAIEPSRSHSCGYADVPPFSADCVATGLDAVAGFLKADPFMTVCCQEYKGFWPYSCFRGWRSQAFADGFYSFVPQGAVPLDGRLRPWEVMVSGFEVKMLHQEFGTIRIAEAAVYGQQHDRSKLIGHADAEQEPDFLNRERLGLTMPGLGLLKPSPEPGQVAPTLIGSVAKNCPDALDPARYGVGSESLGLPCPIGACEVVGAQILDKGIASNDFPKLLCCDPIVLSTSRGEPSSFYIDGSFFGVFNENLYQRSFGRSQLFWCLRISVDGPSTPMILRECFLRIGDGNPQHLAFVFLNPCVPAFVGREREAGVRLSQHGRESKQDRR